MKRDRGCRASEQQQSAADREEPERDRNTLLRARSLAIHCTTKRMVNNAWPA
jgi:hypothetical protein